MFSSLLMMMKKSEISSNLMTDKMLPFCLTAMINELIGNHYLYLENIFKDSTQVFYCLTSIVEQLQWGLQMNFDWNICWIGCLPLAWRLLGS